MKNMLKINPRLLITLKMLKHKSKTVSHVRKMLKTKPRL